jgi:hypothetical protein
MRLKHLIEQRVNDIMQHKRLCKLLSLDDVIEYKKGSENKVADVLTRRGVKEEILAMSELMP